LADPFEISFDTVNRILHLRVWGFWSGKEAQRYRDALQATVSSFRNQKWSILADVRLFPVQTLPVRTVHRDLMEYSLGCGAVRWANVVGGLLTRLQIERLASDVCPNISMFGYFSTESEAKKWLLEKEIERSSTEGSRLFQAV